jgi:hypothetical protein
MSVNFSGVWNANLHKSRLSGPSPSAISVKIAQSDTELTQQMIVTKLDGSEDRVVFYCCTNGEQDRNLLNGRPVHGSARWEGEELVIESWIRFGTRKMHFCDFWSLSADRRTLIMEHRSGDLTGQLTVLERVE